MITKGIIFFHSILLLFFLIGLLLLSISYIIPIIWILITINLQLLITFTIKIKNKPLIWQQEYLENHLISPCDGVIESINIIDKWSNFNEKHYVIEIINQLPQATNRISPIKGSIVINNFINKNKNSLQIEAIIKKNDFHIGIGDISFQKGKGFIKSIPNKYLINDVIEQFFFKNKVEYGDNLWSVYFYSKCFLYIPVKNFQLQVIENQTLIIGETTLGIY
jgi:hypothetical protein